MKLGPQQVVICVDYTGQSVSMVFILPSNNGGGVISPRVSSTVLSTAQHSAWYLIFDVLKHLSKLKYYSRKRLYQAQLPLPVGKQKCK